MKLYTLEYDCNRPTVQQVNIPTNTDYKIGVKVRRNGEIQNLSPESVTLGGLSADVKKTNGYVTFTLSAGDEASYTNEKLDIDKGYDFADTLWNSGGPAVAGDYANFLSAESSAEQLGIAGFEMTMNDIEWGSTLSGTAQLTPADITKWYTAQTFTASQNVFFKWPNGNVALAYVATNKNAFLWYSEDGTQLGWKERVTIDPRWILTAGGQGRGYKAQAGKYWVAAYKFKLGTPWTTKFDLNTNIFKSQQGDITETVVDMPAVKVDGTYADGTEFSYSFVMK